MIQPTRLKALRPGEPRHGQYVLYWMQSSVRASTNHALEYATRQANTLGLPLLVVFGLTPGYPSANTRHYTFLLQGLSDVAAALAERRTAFMVGLVGEHGPPEAALALADQAALLVTDRGYLQTSRQWRGWLAGELDQAQPDLPLMQVESDTVVPVDSASTKQEFAARTIRPKLHRLLPEYLVPLSESRPQQQLAALPHPAGPRWLTRAELDQPAALIGSFGLETVPPGTEPGGHTAAAARLAEFLPQLEHYDEDRNNPNLDGSSRVSAYLHYGHLAPLEAALAAQQAAAGQGERAAAGLAAFLEELIVRRELSLNLCERHPGYATYAVVPAWAQQTLAEHRGDQRDYLYTRAQLEAAATHDPYWNAAQRQMMQTGRMHNYLRMYWGKKVLEWTPDPAEAHATIVYLNDKYEQDGRNPNSYAGIGWVFGLHDRPWGRRPVFGTVRYMNAGGLKRKFDIEAYARRWNGG